MISTKNYIRLSLTASSVLFSTCIYRLFYYIFCLAYDASSFIRSFPLIIANFIPTLLLAMLILVLCSKNKHAYKSRLFFGGIIGGFFSFVSSIYMIVMLSNKTYYTQDFLSLSTFFPVDIFLIDITCLIIFISMIIYSKRCDPILIEDNRSLSNIGTSSLYFLATILSSFTFGAFSIDISNTFKCEYYHSVFVSFIYIAILLSTLVTLITPYLKRTKSNLIIELLATFIVLLVASIPFIIDSNRYIYEARIISSLLSPSLYWLVPVMIFSSSLVSLVMFLISYFKKKANR